MSTRIRCVAAALCTACAVGAAAAPAARAADTSPQVQTARARTVDIKHVALDLRFDWTARAAHGIATLTLAPLRATDQVRLDAGMLSIDSVALAGGAPLRFDYDGGERDDGLRIVLDRVYAPRESLTIRIAYRTRWVNDSDPNNLAGSNGRGLRFLAPTSTEPGRRRQIWASGEPGANRTWFPGFDAPNDLRTSEFTATVEAPLTVIAGGRLVGVTTHADGSRTFRWKTDAPEQNHRLSFVVGEFHDVVQHHDGIPLHSIGYPDEAEGVAASVVLLPDMMRFFTALTGMRYPYESYTQVFVQDLPWNTPGTAFAVQTENMVDDAGTHADFLYLWDGLQAESLAQQWFGGHIGVCDWSHAWLERAFAHHLAGLYTEHRHGRDEFLLWYLQADHASYFGDWNQGLREAVVEAQPKDVAAFVTGNAPYARGAAVLHMLRAHLGEAAWGRAIRHYVRANAGRLACTDDLRRSVEAVSGKSMAWFFDQWVYRPGHPIFEVSKSYDAAARRLVLRVQQLQDSTPGAAHAKFYQGVVTIRIDDRVRRVRLAPRSQNVYAFNAPREPKQVDFDHDGAWLKELRFVKPTAELLHQFRHGTDTPGRHRAMQELVTRARDPALPEADRQRILSAFRDVVAGRAYWRVRFNALQQLTSLLAPAQPAQPVALDETTRAMLLEVIGDESAWLRTAAIRLLGATRDPHYAELYLRYLADPSDRVVNAAAIALGRSGSASAFEALTALPARPSWKNQSLISALNGLAELRDPRGAELASKALSDLTSARWTLATPVWDFRLAAAETLVALGRTESAAGTILERFERSMAEGGVNDIFSNTLLLVTLADPRAEPVFARLRQRFAGDANAQKAIAQYEAQWAKKVEAR